MLTAATILDGYLRLILTSWPAVVLIIGLLLLFRHRPAIDNLLKRMTRFGPMEASSPAEEQQKNEEGTKELAALISESRAAVQEAQKKILYERVYGMIFGGQIKILGDLYLRRGNVQLAEELPHYASAMQRYPDLKIPFINYLNFLNVAGLTTFEHENNTDYIKITPLGIGFYEYINQQNLAHDKAY